MPDAVEIYICKKGQKIEEGQMVMSHDIDSKEAALADAQQRCKIIPSIWKIVYYAVDGGGGFSAYFSYENPNMKEAKSGPKRVRPGGGNVAPVKKKSRKKPQGFWARVKKALT